MGIRIKGDDCPCIIKQKLYDGDSHHLNRSSWIKKAQNVPTLHLLILHHHGWCAPINLLLIHYFTRHMIFLSIFCAYYPPQIDGCGNVHSRSWTCSSHTISTNSKLATFHVCIHYWSTHCSHAHKECNTYTRHSFSVRFIDCFVYVHAPFTHHSHEHIECNTYNMHFLGAKSTFGPQVD